MKKFLFFWIALMGISGISQEMVPQLFSGDGSVKLTSQEVTVNIAGVMADVRLRQTFILNSSDEVSYLFPIGLHTSLHDLQVIYPESIFKLNSWNMSSIRKQVQAENKKRKNIRLGNSEERNFIRMELPPTADSTFIIVEAAYVQNLEEEGSLKKFELSSFRIPKYTDSEVDYKFKAQVFSPTRIRDYNLSGLEAKVQKVSTNYLSFDYTGKEVDKKIVFSYNSRGGDTEAGVLVYEDRGCRYILGRIEPPEVIMPEHVAPREYIFVMDVSGSMHGFPLETSKMLVTRILNDLRPDEKFNILFFEGESDFFAPESVAASRANKELAIQSINQQKGKGKTQLSDALKKVYDYPENRNFNRMVILVTDGGFAVDRSMFSELRNNLENAQYFVFGIGYAIGRKVLQQIASVAGTDPVLIYEQAEAERDLERFFVKVKSPLLRHIEVSSRQINLKDTYPSPFNGFLSHEAEDFIIRECGGKKDAELTLTGIDGPEDFRMNFSLKREKDNEALAALKYIWAEHKITSLLQEEERCGEICVRNGRYRNQIIRLGEEFNISTPYTSFIQEGYVNFEGTGKQGRRLSLYEDANAHIVFQNDFDSDFDGVPNTIDECPFDYGLPNRRGCPRTKQEKITEEINRMIVGIEFDFDSYVIKEEFFEKLDIAADVINNQPEQKYKVEGHTDAAGTPQYNMELSLNRAKAVAAYLQKRGVSPKQLKVTGKGDTELLHPECRPQEVCEDKKNFENRRVVFIPLE